MDKIYKKIQNMTNKDAADIIRNSLLTMNVGRGNGKTIMVATIERALIKAVEALEKTPD